MILDHFLLKEDEPQGQEAPPYYFSLMKDAQPFSFSLKASDASVSIRPATSKKSEKSVRVIATDSLEELKKWRSAMQAKCINSNPNRVFGVHITNLLKRKDAQLIPAVMVRTIEQIEKEGKKKKTKPPAHSVSSSFPLTLHVPIFIQGFKRRGYSGFVVVGQR